MMTKPDPTPTAAPKPELPPFVPQFEDAAVPASTRTVAIPNPYLDTVKALAATMTGDPIRSARGVAMTVPDGHVARAVRQLSEAGKAQDVTVRHQRSAVAEKGHTRITFYTVPLIVHKPHTTAPATEPTTAT